jgi:hypothetical protein
MFVFVGSISCNLYVYKNELMNRHEQPDIQHKTRDFDVTILTIIRVLAITNDYVYQSIAVFIKRLRISKYSTDGLGNSFYMRWFKTGFFSLFEGSCYTLCLYRLRQTDLIPSVKFAVYAMLKVVVMNVIRDYAKPFSKKSP